MATQSKIGRRVLRVGQRVKIDGLRGLYKIQHFSDDLTTVTVYGGPPNRVESTRIVAVERIGRRPVALNKEAGHL